MATGQSLYKRRLGGVYTQSDVGARPSEGAAGRESGSRSRPSDAGLLRCLPDVRDDECADDAGRSRDVGLVAAARPASPVASESDGWDEGLGRDEEPARRGAYADASQGDEDGPAEAPQRVRGAREDRQEPRPKLTGREVRLGCADDAICDFSDLAKKSDDWLLVDHGIVWDV